MRLASAPPALDRMRARWFAGNAIAPHAPRSSLRTRHRARARAPAGLIRPDAIAGEPRHAARDVLTAIDPGWSDADLLDRSASYLVEGHQARALAIITAKEAADPAMKRSDL